MFGRDIRVLKTLFVIRLLIYIEYPLQFFVSVLWGILGTLLLFFLWQYIIAQGHFTIYKLKDILLYFAFVAFLGFSTTWGFWLRDNIISGDVSYDIVRPMNLENLYFYKIMPEFIYRVLGLIIVLILGVYFIGLKSLLGVLFYFFGITIGIFIIEIFVFLGFWFGQVRGIFYTLDQVFELTTGQYFPIDILPIFWQKFFVFMPFKYVLFVPAQIYLGRINVSLKLVLIYVFWIIAMYLFAKIIRYYGLRRYEQLGG